MAREGAREARGKARGSRRTRAAAGQAADAKREVEALIGELAHHGPGMTLLFASHNLGQVKRLATDEDVYVLAQSDARIDKEAACDASGCAATSSD